MYLTITKSNEVYQTHLLEQYDVFTKKPFTFFFALHFVFLWLAEAEYLLCLPKSTVFEVCFLEIIVVFDT